MLTSEIAAQTQHLLGLTHVYQGVCLTCVEDVRLDMSLHVPVVLGFSTVYTLDFSTVYT